MLKTSHFSLKLMFRSVAIGVVAALAFGALAFVAAPMFDAVGIYITPARLLLPAIQQVIPSRLLHWLVPDGGAPAGVAVILSSAALFWAVIFGIAYFAWATLGRKHAPHGATTANS